MTLFVVAYDLSHSSSYDDLIDSLKALDSCHTQESVWYVSRSGTARDLRQHLEEHVHEKDKLMVVTFTQRPSYNRAMVGTNDWLDDHF